MGIPGLGLLTSELVSTIILPWVGGIEMAGIAAGAAGLTLVFFAEVMILPMLITLVLVGGAVFLGGLAGGALGGLLTGIGWGSSGSRIAIPSLTGVKIPTTSTITPFWDPSWDPNSDLLPPPDLPDPDDDWDPKRCDVKIPDLDITTKDINDARYLVSKLTQGSGEGAVLLTLAPQAVRELVSGWGQRQVNLVGPVFDQNTGTWRPQLTGDKATYLHQQYNVEGLRPAPDATLRLHADTPQDAFTSFPDPQSGNPYLDRLVMRGLQTIEPGPDGLPQTYQPHPIVLIRTPEGNLKTLLVRTGNDYLNVLLDRGVQTLQDLPPYDPHDPLELKITELQLGYEELVKLPPEDKISRTTEARIQALRGNVTPELEVLLTRDPAEVVIDMSALTIGEIAQKLISLPTPTRIPIETPIPDAKTLQTPQGKLKYIDQRIKELTERMFKEGEDIDKAEYEELQSLLKIQDAPEAPPLPTEKPTAKKPLKPYKIARRTKIKLARNERKMARFYKKAAKLRAKEDKEKAKDRKRISQTWKKKDDRWSREVVPQAEKPQPQTQEIPEAPEIDPGSYYISKSGKLVYKLFGGGKTKKETQEAIDDLQDQLDILNDDTQEETENVEKTTVTKQQRKNDVSKKAFLRRQIARLRRDLQPAETEAPIFDVNLFFQDTIQTPNQQPVTTSFAQQMLDLAVTRRREAEANAAEDQANLAMVRRGEAAAKRETNRRRKEALTRAAMDMMDMTLTFLGPEMDRLRTQIIDSSPSKLLSLNLPLLETFWRWYRDYTHRGALVNLALPIPAPSVEEEYDSDGESEFDSDDDTTQEPVYFKDYDPDDDLDPSQFYRSKDGTILRKLKGGGKTKKKTQDAIDHLQDQLDRLDDDTTEETENIEKTTETTKQRKQLARRKFLLQRQIILLRRQIAKSKEVQVQESVQTETQRPEFDVNLFFQDTNQMPAQQLFLTPEAQGYWGMFKLFGKKTKPSPSDFYRKRDEDRKTAAPWKKRAIARRDTRYNNLTRLKDYWKRFKKPIVDLVNRRETRRSYRTFLLALETRREGIATSEMVPVPPRAMEMEPEPSAVFYDSDDYSSELSDIDDDTITGLKKFKDYDSDDDFSPDFYTSKSGKRIYKLKGGAKKKKKQTIAEDFDDLLVAQGLVEPISISTVLDEIQEANPEENIEKKEVAQLFETLTGTVQPQVEVQVTPPQEVKVQVAAPQEIELGYITSQAELDRITKAEDKYDREVKQFKKFSAKLKRIKILKQKRREQQRKKVALQYERIKILKQKRREQQLKKVTLQYVRGVPHEGFIFYPTNPDPMPGFGGTTVLESAKSLEQASSYFETKKILSAMTTIQLEAIQRHYDLGRPGSIVSKNVFISDDPSKLKTLADSPLDFLRFREETELESIAKLDLLRARTIITRIRQGDETVPVDLPGWSEGVMTVLRNWFTDNPEDLSKLPFLSVRSFSPANLRTTRETRQLNRKLKRQRAEMILYEEKRQHRLAAPVKSIESMIEESYPSEEVTQESPKPIETLERLHLQFLKLETRDKTFHVPSVMTGLKRLITVREELLFWQKKELLLQSEESTLHLKGIERQEKHLVILKKQLAGIKKTYEEHPDLFKEEFLSTLETREKSLRKEARKAAKVAIEAQDQYQRLHAIMESSQIKSDFIQGVGQFKDIRNKKKPLPAAKSKRLKSIIQEHALRLSLLKKGELLGDVLRPLGSVAESATPEEFTTEQQEEVTAQFEPYRNRKLREAMKKRIAARKIKIDALKKELKQVLRDKQENKEKHENRLKVAADTELRTRIIGGKVVLTEHKKPVFDKLLADQANQRGKAAAKKISAELDKLIALREASEPTELRTRIIGGKVVLTEYKKSVLDKRRAADAFYAQKEKELVGEREHKTISIPLPKALKRRISKKRAKIKSEKRLKSIRKEQLAVKDFAQTVEAIKREENISKELDDKESDLKITLRNMEIEIEAEERQERDRLRKERLDRIKDNLNKQASTMLDSIVTEPLLKNWLATSKKSLKDFTSKRGRRRAKRKLKKRFKQFGGEIDSVFNKLKPSKTFNPEKATISRARDRAPVPTVAPRGGGGGGDGDGDGDGGGLTPEKKRKLLKIAGLSAGVVIAVGATIALGIGITALIIQDTKDKPEPDPEPTPEPWPEPPDPWQLRSAHPDFQDGFKDYFDPQIFIEKAMTNRRLF